MTGKQHRYHQNLASDKQAAAFNYISPFMAVTRQDSWRFHISPYQVGEYALAPVSGVFSRGLRAS